MERDREALGNAAGKRYRETLGRRYRAGATGSPIEDAKGRRYRDRYRDRYREALWEGAIGRRYRERDRAAL